MIPADPNAGISSRGEFDSKPARPKISTVLRLCDEIPDEECDARPDCVGCPAYAESDAKWGRRA